MKTRTLERSKQKQHCPCCASVDLRWCYRFYNLWYCVECLRGIHGHGPAWLFRHF